jgi:mannose-6-phosphate isomerase-like protein (cupin superfamily)
MEIHADVDQFFFFEKGEGVVMIDAPGNRVKDEAYSERW